MTTLQLHPLPSLRAVIREQFRAVTLVSRKFLVLLGVLIVIGDAAVVYSLIAAKQLAARGLPNLGVAILPNFGPQQSFIIGLVGIMLAVLIWIDEDPSRRDYHWTMPLGRTAHAMTKIFVGWVLLMATTLVALTNMLVMGEVSLRVQYLEGMTLQAMPFWVYLVPFGTATVAYLFASAAAIGARRPIVWIMGVPLLYTGVLMVSSLGSFAMKKAMAKPLTAEYGLASVLGDVVRQSYVDYHATPQFMLVRWIGSVVIWGAIAGGLLLYVASRRPRNVGTWAFALLNRWASRYVTSALLLTLISSTNVHAQVDDASREHVTTDTD